jgi:hypothetical protein
MHSKLNSPAQDIIFLKSNSSPKGKSHKIKAKKNPPKHKRFLLCMEGV